MKENTLQSLELRWVKDEQGKRLPFVSIIVPVLNEERNIPRFYNSWKSQTYKNFEIIFIDDKSTDNTIPIIKKIAQKDQRVKLILGGPRKGPSYNSNLGIQNAKGKILFFPGAVTGTHYRDPNYLKLVTTLFKDTTVDVVGVPTQRTIIGKEKRLYKLYEATMKEPSATKGLATLEFFYRKETIQEAGGFDEKLVYGGIEDLYNRVMKLNPKVIISTKWIKVGVIHKFSLKSYFKRGKWYGQTIFRFLRKQKTRYPRLLLYLTPTILFAASILLFTLKLYPYALVSTLVLLLAPPVWCIVNIYTKKIRGLTTRDIPLIFLVWIPLTLVYTGFLYGILRQLLKPTRGYISRD
jgi:glycosyltransferase involved in cell wall biosynthesis